jgi:hypothetical protein
MHNGKSMQLEYFLLESDAAYSDGAGYEKTYGIEIVKKENFCVTEDEIITDICSDRSEAKALLDRISRNIVTPMELKFILDDMVGISA